ncbi:MbtH family NRPS accessory protein [Streptomyces phyllanthi]|nr:MbtH family NRPS accessory protein [Streptomyces phyllanthi]
MQAPLEYEARETLQCADGAYLMLVDEEGRYSVWPSGVVIPRGWTLVLTTTERKKAVEAIGGRLPDLRAVTFAKRGSLRA